MASTIKENGCICGSDLFLTNVNTLSGTIVFAYDCTNRECQAIAFFKDKRKKYNHIRLEVKQDG